MRVDTNVVGGAETLAPARTWVGGIHIWPWRGAGDVACVGVGGGVGVHATIRGV